MSVQPSDAGTLLVTGSAGFVGRALVAELRAADIPFIEQPHAWASKQELGLVLGDVAVSCCIHLGWYADPRDYQTNVLANSRSLAASLQLAEILVERGCRHLVATGSCLEYASGSRPHSESDPLDVSVPYAFFKDALRRSLSGPYRDVGLETAWARLFNVVGEGEHPSRIVPHVAQSISGGAAVALSPGDQVRDYIDVRDAARALLDLSRCRATGEFNVSTGVGTSLRDFLTAVAARIGDTSTLGFGQRAYAPGERMTVVGHPQAIQTVTGWRPRWTGIELAGRVGDHWRGQVVDRTRP